MREIFFLINVLDTELISKIYKEFLVIDMKKTDDTIKK